MNNTFVIISALLFVAVILAIEGAYLWWNSTRGPEARRMAERLRKMSAGGHASAASQTLLKERLLSQSQLGQRLLLKVPRITGLDRFLIQTGTGTTVGAFIAITTIVFLAGLFCGMVLQLPNWISVLLGLAVALIPLQRLQRKRTSRLLQFENLMPDALDLMSRSMRAGHAFSSALQMVGNEMPDPVGEEFRTTFDEINFGISGQDALLNLAERVPSVDLRFFVIAVMIQRETGGNLTEILGNISGIIRDRLKLNGRVRVLSAEGRLSAWILSILPFATAGGLFLMNRELLSLLWTTQPGLYMIYFAMAMMTVGIFWVRKAVRIRV